VLKGPASVLYGRAEPGGVINIVTKQPLQEERYVIEQQVNSWADYLTTLDATGPLTTDKSLLYRINISSDQARSFQQFSGGQDYFVAPTFRWNIDNTTYVNFYADYHYRGFTDYSGAPAYTNARDPAVSNSLGVVPSVAFGDVPISFLPRNRNFVDPWTRGNNDDVVAAWISFSLERSLLRSDFRLRLAHRLSRALRRALDWSCGARR
jgi:iron complex outermembrane receptor protein